MMYYTMEPQVSIFDIESSYGPTILTAIQCIRHLHFDKSCYANCDSCIHVLTGV